MVAALQPWKAQREWETAGALGHPRLPATRHGFWQRAVPGSTGTGGVAGFGRNRTIVAQRLLHCNINARIACRGVNVRVGTPLLSRIHPHRAHALKARKFQGILVIRLPACLAAALAPVLSLTLVLVAITGCGSGAVSAPATTPTPTAISILPATATLYSGLPTTFSISGGNGAYILASTDQAAVPLGGSTTATSLTVIPGAVATDTPVTLTVRDTLGSQATATLTVKPRTISNVITVTPSATQAAACGTAVCSGGDANVTVVLTQNGVPLSNRDVRFDVVSGDFRIITSAPGLPEATSLSGTTRTDATGAATIRVRALTDATAQTALLQVTDISGGNTLRASFSIYPVSSAPLSAAPATVQFVGPNAASCATSGNRADVIVFGGRAPYQITQPASFQVSPTTLTASGQRFTVSPNGNCSAAAPIGIVDANGASVSVSVSNVAGTTTVTTSPLAVSPAEVTLDSCNTIAQIAIAGGRGAGTYFAVSGNNAVKVAVSSDTATNSGTARISRDVATPPPGSSIPSPVTVSISDGQTVQDVTVNLVGQGAGKCPLP